MLPSLGDYYSRYGPPRSRSFTDPPVDTVLAGREPYRYVLHITSNLASTRIFPASLASGSVPSGAESQSLPLTLSFGTHGTLVGEEWRVSVAAAGAVITVHECFARPWSQEDLEDRDGDETCSDALPQRQRGGSVFRSTVAESQATGPDSGPPVSW